MNKEKIKAAILAIGLTIPIITVLLFISVKIFDEYGASLFYVSPLMCGAFASVIYNWKTTHSLKSSVSVSLLSGVFSLLGFFAFGLEGAICLVMAAPIMLPMFVFGGAIGYSIHQSIKNPRHQQGIMILMLCIAPLMMGIESRIPSSPSVREVKTRVVIQGDINDVWHEVIAFSTIPEPTEWLFKMGIAYPIDAKIDGQGVGAVRYCNFSTGSFVEPITVWQENDLLAFDVTAQPLPMTEMSPYVNIHPPHLDWAFVSHKGQFKLNQLDNGTVELIGTTWFHTEIKPEFYWGRICEELIHIIHNRVLNHIKQSVETKTTDQSM